jgi:hypothetical protein
MQPDLDIDLLFSAAIALLALAAGYMVNNRRARLATEIVTDLVESIRQYDRAISDGTISTEEERKIGEIAIRIYGRARELGGVIFQGR